MRHETLVKRTIYVAKCPTCHESRTETEAVSKERFCMTCSIWVPFVEHSWTGPSLSHRFGKE